MKPGCEKPLLQAIEEGTLGRGSVAEGEYLRNMDEARMDGDETARWIEICYCLRLCSKSGPIGKSISS